MAIFAVVAAAVAALIAVAALVFVLVDRARQVGEPVVAPSGASVPSLESAPPAGVRLDDQGATVAVSWTDPAGGQIPFMITMGRPGEPLKPVASTGAGETSFRMTGLNVGLDYCFAVVAVYATDRFAASEQACTRRS
ncbi:fibronectin type III domain-containing protein [Actinoplanes sp. NPDC024001]|uniref:fibronectin type III domain-containing protein n=1 Tax=Actinoplanes sp. NPDC024001 TaxID=3154598 RepID=UPI003402211D